MRILWLSNCVLSHGDHNTTGAWLDALAEQLAACGNVTLGNISSNPVRTLSRNDCGRIKQWIVPVSSTSARNGLPPNKLVGDILNTVNEFAPDLVHVWGTESYWGLLTARRFIIQPALLDMQGLKIAIAPVFAGGLSFKQQLACVGLKELIRRATIPQERKSFRKWGTFEREIIFGHRYVATQTDWIKAHVQSINPRCSIFHTDLVLRQPFYQFRSWRFSQRPVLFCSAAYALPFKGLHVAIRAAALLKRNLPNVELRIAGGHRRPGLRKQGYVAWLEQQSRRLGIAENVTWLGSLSSGQIYRELNTASAMILPSYMENCSTSMQEAMIAGIPIVASYSGGLPSLARDEESALFFTPGDEAMCAYQLERVLSNRELALRLSKNAMKIARERNDPETIGSRQLEIYRQVIDDARGEHE